VQQHRVGVVQERKHARGPVGGEQVEVRHAPADQRVAAQVIGDVQPGDHHLGGIAARRGDDNAAARFNAAAEALARSFGALVIPIPPVVEPILAAEARMAPEDLAREREIGRALGVDAILSTALEAWRRERNRLEASRT
jgi:hypothetical protein